MPLKITVTVLLTEPGNLACHSRTEGEAGAFDMGVAAAALLETADQLREAIRQQLIDAGESTEQFDAGILNQAAMNPICREVRGSMRQTAPSAAGQTIPAGVTVGRDLRLPMAADNAAATIGPDDLVEPAAEPPTARDIERAAQADAQANPDPFDPQ